MTQQTTIVVIVNTQLNGIKKYKEHSFSFSVKNVKLNTYDNFTLNSLFRPKAFIKKKHALQYQNMHFNINYILCS